MSAGGFQVEGRPRPRTGSTQWCNTTNRHRDTSAPWEFRSFAGRDFDERDQSLRCQWPSVNDPSHGILPGKNPRAAYKDATTAVAHHCWGSCPVRTATHEPPIPGVYAPTHSRLEGGCDYCARSRRCRSAHRHRAHGGWQFGHDFHC